MAEADKNWTNWNPIVEDFEKTTNKYEIVTEAPANYTLKQERIIKQSKYPYLIVKKKNQYITENLLINYFGDIIHDIEYRSLSRAFCVYFYNIGSLEAAWTKIRQFPDIVHCVEGRTRHNNSVELPEINPAEQTKADAPPQRGFETVVVDLKSRTIQVSAHKKRHPEYLRTPIVTKANYEAKNSLLAENDPTLRYLHVKFEFMLERHGAYTLQESIERDKAVLHFRTGRLIVAPQNGIESHPVDFEPKLDKLAKKCLACNCYTDNSCRTCQMPFCNPICFDQLADVHQNCEAGKPPVINEAIVSQFIGLSLPPSRSNVKLCAFEQSNVVYVRSAEVVDEIAYYKVISDVMMRGKLAPKLVHLPQCGQVVIYKSSIQIVRAMVLNADNPLEIYVVCVDFGNVEITTFESLYECNTYLAGLPRYAVPVLLRGVPKRYMSPNLRSMLYELDHTYTFVLRYSTSDFDHEQGMQSVILVESEMNRSLNRLIKTIVTPVEPSISDIGFQEEYLQHVQLPTGKNIELVIMDNSFIKFGIIHCTILDYAYEITEMQRDIQFYGDSIAKSASFAAPQNYLCIAKYQGKWCRGLCLELVGDGFPSILFIDYGNIQPVKVDDIRPYPPQFTFPMLTTEYEILDLPSDLTDEQIKKLEKHLTLGSIINCQEIIYNEQENNYSMRLDVSQKLLMQN